MGSICESHARPFLELRGQHAPGLFGFQSGDTRPRAGTLGEAFAPVVFPELLAQRLGRPRKPTDNWLPLPVPDVLARVFGGGASIDAGRAWLRQRLAVLCAGLDERLENPLQITVERASRLVTICGCVAFRVDLVARQVRPARVFADGRVQEQSIEAEVQRPLRTGWWLHWLLQNLGLSALQGQGSLFVSREDVRRHDDWLTSTAQRLLLGDPRFVWLREEGIPRALGLDTHLLAIAAHARYPAWRGRVPKSTFNLVWTHETQFRQVARENPHLLGLLETFLWERALPLKDDPVAEMRDYFHDKGLADASWRYVHRHGSRIFRIPLLMSADKSALAACVGYLRVLEEAGLPPPPSPALARAWIRCRGVRIRFSEDWCTPQRSVIRVILREAHARRSSPGFAEFVADAVGVLHWAIATRVKLNPQQARSGWHWLRRHWNAWRGRQRREAAVTNCRWESLVPALQIGRFDVVPLTSGPDLVEEAFEMRHCVDSYVDSCRTGVNRIFSVRCREHGKRVATLSIRRQRSEVWVRLQVARFANRPASRELDQLGAKVANLYSAAERALDLPD